MIAPFTNMGGGAGGVIDSASGTHDGIIGMAKGLLFSPIGMVVAAYVALKTVM